MHHRILNYEPCNKSWFNLVHGMDNTVEISYDYTVSEAIFNTTSTSVFMDSKERNACSLRQATVEREGKRRLHHD